MGIPRILHVKRTMAVTFKTYRGLLSAKAYVTIRKQTRARGFKGDGTSRQVHVVYFVKKNGEKSGLYKHECMTCIPNMFAECDSPDYLVSKVLVGKEAGYDYSTKNPAVLDTYLDWLCSNSPWSQCVVSKGAEDCRKYGLILDCSYPYDLVSGASIALRNTSEGQCGVGIFLKKWYVLTEAGATGTEAYLLAVGLETTTSGYSPRSGLWHTALVYLYQMPKKNVLNYLGGVPVSGVGSMKDKGKQGGNSATWGELSSDGTLKRHLNKCAKERITTDEWGDDTRTYTITLIQAIEGFREWIRS